MPYRAHARRQGARAATARAGPSRAPISANCLAGDLRTRRGDRRAHSRAQRLDERSPGLAARATIAAGEQTLSSQQPVPIVVARVGALSLKLPIARRSVTAIGYHASPDTVALSPEGTQVNEGLFARLFHRHRGLRRRRPQLLRAVGRSREPTTARSMSERRRGRTSTRPSTARSCRSGRTWSAGYSRGMRIDIRPDADATLIVSMTRLRPDPHWQIGKPVIAGCDAGGKHHRLLPDRAPEARALHAGSGQPRDDRGLPGRDVDPPLASGRLR